METLPGIYPDMDEAEYHGHPALSASGIKILAQPGGPAKWHWLQTHGQPHKKAYDVGHAVHALILGVGAPIARIPDELLAVNGANSRKEGKAWVDAARAEGRIPFKEAEADLIEAMAEAVLAHRPARQLLEQAPMREVSLFRRHERTGAELRSRIDAVGPGALVDIKSARSADPAEFARDARKLGYHIQAQFYEDMARAHNLTDQPLRFVTVEKEPPFLPSVTEVDPIDKSIGLSQIERAIDAWTHGNTTGEWPGYPERITTLSFPGWWRDAHDQEVSQEIEDEFAAFFAERAQKGNQS